MNNYFYYVFHSQIKNIFLSYLELIHSFFYGYYEYLVFLICVIASCVSRPIIITLNWMKLDLLSLVNIVKTVHKQQMSLAVNDKNEQITMT